jgi:hypothetical protein
MGRLGLFVLGSLVSRLFCVRASVLRVRGCAHLKEWVGHHICGAALQVAEALI